jgi:hypothetical protein
MGVYADHGVEYHVVCRDGRRIVVASTRDTNVRLTQSAYYNARKDTWLSVDTMYGKGSYMNKIIDPYFDVDLTYQELLSLDMIIQQHHDIVLEHGWYEVNTVTSSL